MVFSSISFLFIFLPIFFFFYYVVVDRYKNHVLLCGSLLFYIWGEPVYIFLLLFSAYVNYWNGRMLGRENSPYARKKYLWIALGINLLLLGFFKYSDFLLSIINTLFHTSFPMLELGLPIGISFYTFQTMSYSIDVYRGKIKPEKNYFTYLTYLSMFPQLVAGPIVRYDSIQDSLRKRVITFSDFAQGMVRFLRGLFKKVLLANTIGSLWLMIFSNELSMMSAWLGVLAFSLQIYFDFSGYSDMAIGLGKMLGFTFPENFRYPYMAKSITDFWRRWHITLSSWFKDYVYIPLGGSRCGKKRTCISICVVWFLTGLWHGASWNFCIWGLYFGILLIIEKLFLGSRQEKWNLFIKRCYTLFLVGISWVLFAITDMDQLKNYLLALFDVSSFIDSNFFYYLKSYFILLVIGCICATPIPQNLGKYMGYSNGWIYVGRILFYVVGFILTIAYLVSDTYNPFLYFRF